MSMFKKPKVVLTDPTERLLLELAFELVEVIENKKVNAFRRLIIKAYLAEYSKVLTPLSLKNARIKRAA